MSGVCCETGEKNVIVDRVQKTKNGRRPKMNNRRGNRLPMIHRDILRRKVHGYNRRRSARYPEKSRSLLPSESQRVAAY